MKTRIKELCNDKGITQAQLANLLGATQATLSRQIKGNPTLDTLTKIANALKVNVWELLTVSLDTYSEVIHLIIKDELKVFNSINELKKYIEEV